MLKSMKGFTFSEIMIALTLNTFLLAGLITIFMANLGHYRTAINTARLNQNLQAAMDLMASEIRRAGYWANARSDISGTANNNPFMAASTDLSINGSSNCILFSYDHDKNGTLPSISSGTDDERYGFRLNNQAIQTRPPGASFNCSGNDWENITDSNVVQITNLSFTLITKTLVTGPGAKGIYLRGVTISITGRLSLDNSVTRTITQYVRIRNDKFYP